jgi:thiol-disulfide isomerase/thioredoxin
MRKILLGLTVFLFCCGNLSLFSQEVNYSDPQTWLLGYFKADDLLQYPHSDWFNKQFDSYKIDDEALIELMNMDLEDIEVIVVLGTWCPDSRREVPRFMKLSQLTGLDQDKVSFIGTDSYKIAPIDDYDNLNIERVPTFIFYYKKNEIGRIIEYPKASLEKDMLNIFEAGGIERSL